jgi:NAD(P)-dependent dehydrogenase (short-subunit alcohol dehydrogenase family)
MQLAGKAALISGAGGGICRAIAVAFAKEGAAVACCDVDPDSSAETARLVTEAGGRALSQACDVTGEAATRAVADAAYEAFGRLDILVHGAAPHDPSGTVIETSLADWQRVLDINLSGAFLLSRATLPHMIAGGGGSIIFIASQLGRVGSAGRAAYCATKGALIQLANHGDRPRGAEHPRQYAVARRGRDAAHAEPLRLVCHGQPADRRQASARPAGTA